MDAIDEVISGQIGSEPMQIARQKRKTCAHSMSLTVFIQRIESDVYLAYQEISR